MRCLPLENKLQLIEKQSTLRKKGKVNFYSLIYKKKKVSENCSIALPANINKDFLGYICDFLDQCKELDSQKYNPAESLEASYEWLCDKSLENNLSKYMDLDNDAPDMDAKNSTKLQNSNLLICDLEFENTRYYIFMRQTPCARLFKGKKIFIIGDGKIESIKNKYGFFLSFNIDCIWKFDQSNPITFIFDKGGFSSIFDYEEHLKKIVLEKKMLIFVFFFFFFF